METTPGHPMNGHPDVVNASDMFLPSTSHGPMSSAHIPFSELVSPPATTKLCLNLDLVDVPSKLLESEELMRSVLENGYATLSDATKEQLKRLLPPGTSEEEGARTVFTSDPNFCFGNPVSHIHKRIKEGYFNPPHTADAVQLRDHCRVLYDHYIRNHYMNLLKKLLTSRHAILEKACNVGSTEDMNGSTLAASSSSPKRKFRVNKHLRDRAHKRAKLMIDHCRRKANDPALSSDESVDEEDDAPVVPLVPGGESTLFHSDFSVADLDLHQPMRIKSVKEMLKEYRRLRETEPDCPSLDIRDITLEEVYDRAGISYQSERNFALTSKGKGGGKHGERQETRQ